MLRNQQAGLDGRGAEAPAGLWREALTAETAALEASPHRLPWQDRLPKAIEESLKPFRARLEAGYSPLINPLELEMPIARAHRGDWGRRVIRFRKTADRLPAEVMRQPRG